jgi:predicted PurR-regulated permease PerM
LVGKALYYLIKKDNYLKISTLLICICSILAVYLNIEGTNCIREINSLSLQYTSLGEDDNTNNANSQRNNTGFSRLDQLQQEQNRQQQDAMLQQSYELRKHCFLVTNLYVYSLFGVIIGFIVLIIWYTRYKRIWTFRKRNSRDDRDNQMGFR